MSNIWLISDTHFNHANILCFKAEDGTLFRGRYFDDVDHMNETMAERWNAVVKPEDKVYHLGDVYMSQGPKANEILKRLHGKKRLILGNHDNGKDQLLQKYFDKIYMWRIFDGEMLLTHVPVHPNSLRGTWNIHGHIHEKKSPPGNYHCVCVEQTDYFPVNYEQLRDQLRSRNTIEAVSS